MANAPDDADAALERELAKLRADYEALHLEQVRAEQTLKHLETELAELERKAQAEYGTSDPEELAGKLAAMRAENASRVERYREHIASVRQGLAGLEQGGDTPGA